MKSIIAAGFLLGCAQGAIAGPYANIEANSSYNGDDYVGSVIENHVVYEGDGWYIQGGPAVSFPDDAEQVGAASGKVGLGVDVTKKLSVYGEVSAITSEGLEIEGLGVGAKTGVKYKF